MDRGSHRYRTVGFALLATLALVAMSLGTALAVGGSHAPAQDEECTLGGPECIDIGITGGWFQGSNVEFQFSHDFFCEEPPSSRATSNCEAGASAQVEPPSGEVGAPVWVLIPRGFTPAADTLHCQVAGMCIDHPDTIDLSRVMNGAGQNAKFPPHSLLIDDDEELNSVWWPAIVVFVNTQNAWNRIVEGKDLATLRAVQHAGHASQDIDTNLFLWFEVFTPEE